MSTNETASNLDRELAPASARLPPKVLRVTPPMTFDSPRRRKTLFIVLAALGVIGCWLLGGKPALYAGGALILLVAAFIVVYWIYDRRYTLRRDAFVRKVPPSELTSKVDELVRHVTRDMLLGGDPTIGDRLRLVKHIVAEDPERSQILCVGMVEVPIVGELRFEPVILTATELLWRRLYLVVAVMILITPNVLYRLGIALPSALRFSVPTIIILLGCWRGFLWFWKAHVRPLYLRLAPGIVEVIEYSVGRKRPDIRRYPMLPGTFVVMTHHQNQQWLMLYREKCCDEFSLHNVRHSKEVVQRVWEALLSTAPIPSLSDEDLLG